MSTKLLRMLLAMLGMRFRPYSNPANVGGWLGWIESRHQKCLGFIHADGQIVFDW